MYDEATEDFGVSIMHEKSTGQTDEWYTPTDLLDAIGETYNLDPCSPGPGKGFVPAEYLYTKEYDGLKGHWEGFVFMNPPFGGRNSHIPWLIKFLEHGNGIALVRAYTSAAWFHDYAIKANAMLFPRGKTKFVRPDGSVGKAPGHGIVLLAMGHRAKIALKNSGLGLYVDLENPKQSILGAWANKKPNGI